MQFILELLFQVVFELVFYGIGRAVLLVCAPHYGVEPAATPPRRGWKWRGWSFEQGGRRYFYLETVQAVGLLTLVILVTLALTATYLSK